MPNESSGLSGIPPKTTFIGGLVFGVLLVGTIGFLFLLTHGQNFGSGKGQAPAAPSAGAQPSGQQPPAAPAPAAPVPPVTDADHVRGAKDAKVTIVEYSDLECPFCQRFHPTVLQALKDYPKDVRLVYRHFPLSSIHPHARAAAEASECVAKIGGQDKFWQYVDAIFGGDQEAQLARLIPLAKEIGVDEAKMKNCVDKKETAKIVDQDYQGGVAAGVQGTPGSFVNGVELGGAVPYDQLKALIDQQLKS